MNSEELHLDLGMALQGDVIPNGDNPGGSGHEEVLIANEEDDNFNDVIGHLEDIVMSDTFQCLQKDFMDRHFKSFDESDENKLEYTAIFNEYVSKIESYIEKELKQLLSSFDMHTFLQELPARQEEIEQELFNILLSFTDFLTFKNMFLEYKREQDGTALDFGDMLLVNGQPATPRSSQSLAQKLGLMNFGCSSNSNGGGGGLHRIQNQSRPSIASSSTPSASGDAMDVETTPAVQYVNGSPVF